MGRLFAAPMRRVVLAVLGAATLLGVAGVFVASADVSSNDYVRGVEYVRVESDSQKTNYHYVVAWCPSGKNAIGGGVDINQYVNGSYALLMSEPKPHQSGTPGLPGAWEGAAGGPNKKGWTIEVWAVCADIHGAPPSSTSGDSSGASSGSSGTSGTSGQSSSGSSGSSGDSSSSGTSSGSSGESSSGSSGSSSSGGTSSGSSGESSSGTSGTSGVSSSGSSGSSGSQRHQRHERLLQQQRRWLEQRLERLLTGRRGLDRGTGTTIRWAAGSHFSSAWRPRESVAG